MKRITTLLLAALLLLSLAACGAKDVWQEQYDLGMHYLNDGNYQEAVIAFTAAIEIDPKRPEAYLGAAEAYIAADDIDAAIDILKKGLTATGDDTSIQDKLAELEDSISENPSRLINTMLENNQVLTYSNIPEVFSRNFDDLDGLLDMQGDREWIGTREEKCTIHSIEFSAKVQVCSYEKINGWNRYYNLAQSTAPIGSRELLAVDISLWDVPTSMSEGLGIIETGWLGICMGDSYAAVLRKLGFEDGLERYKNINVEIYADGRVSGSAAEGGGVTYSCEHTTEDIPQIDVRFYDENSTVGKFVVYEFHEGDALNRVRYENYDLLMKFAVG